MKISFFELEPFEKKFFQKQLKGHILRFENKPLSVRNAEKHKDSDMVVIFILSKVTEAVLEKLPKVKLITTMSTGYNHIDLVAAKKRHIHVSRVPVYGQNTVAECAFTLLQSLNRHIVEAVARTRNGIFDFKGLMGQDLEGKTIGIIGTGHIGEYMIRYAKSFGMKVIATDSFKRKDLAKEYAFKYVSLEQLCKQSDFISLHVPLLPTTYHLLGPKQFKIMKKGVIIVNTGRGPLIDTQALMNALDKKIVGGAALDVLELENEMKKETRYLLQLDNDKKRLLTILENNDLLHRSNVLITPHLAFYTEEAVMRILKTTLQNIKGCIAKRYKNTV